ncbi:ATP-NAD kinase-like domain-containing protein [Kockovaella imperatae]|uniref:ATP-NAD kinase-like domain-containing protein n=1 Tax=Kockovaella imperatae TaxID=4999 RepID=A0A1Y1UME8_9TREE|nr:ATP-NAD kinase-like domain-containing protein [Kockovaella imperatae]ORX39162.1 ATP-NAD kinase-like domain-containing protein [Kockovaella imperatae]
MAPVFHVIVNPAAGHGQAADFVRAKVEPLLKHCQIAYKIHQTSGVKDAGRIGQEIQNSIPLEEPRLVIVAGGDGTAHELIEGILDQSSAGDDQGIGTWRLAILPCGTANALFHSLFPDSHRHDSVGELGQHLATLTNEDEHQLSSLTSAIESLKAPQTNVLPLPITLTTIASQKRIPTHIVLSTSLHASILHDSEALRETMPGIERFKVAASQNMSVAFKADAVLRGTRVRQYSPKTKSFIEPFTISDASISASSSSSSSSSSTKEWVVPGPFSYFLSTTTANRLEQAFVVAPTLSLLPPGSEDGGPSMDIIIIRPGRDPSVIAAQDQGEEATGKMRAKRLGEIAGNIYKNGSHVNLTFARDESGSLEHGGEGEVAVEVFRAQGFDWIPTDTSHQASHYVCADGDIHVIPSGERAIVELMDRHPAGHGFFVWK